MAAISAQGRAVRRGTGASVGHIAQPARTPRPERTGDAELLLPRPNVGPFGIDLSECLSVPPFGFNGVPSLKTSLLFALAHKQL